MPLQRYTHAVTLHAPIKWRKPSGTIGKLHIKVHVLGDSFVTMADRERGDGSKYCGGQFWLLASYFYLTFRRLFFRHGADSFDDHYTIHGERAGPSSSQILV